jgi:hypothetical protein
MSTPTDGFYEATVALDSGGEAVWPVRVHAGHVFTARGREIRVSACRDFVSTPLSIAMYLWPDYVQAEYERMASRLKELEAVTKDPQALWTNWLRGTVQLPAGIGDIRQSGERAKRMGEAVDLAIQTLEMVKSNVEHEIRQRELVGRSANQWPDVLNGWVSGGGIIAVLEALNAAKKGEA